jgi:hypothetical protein
MGLTRRFASIEPQKTEKQGKNEPPRGKLEPKVRRTFGSARY